MSGWLPPAWLGAVASLVVCPTDPVRPCRISIYALGGGAGHLTRGGALARALVARGHRCQLIFPAERRDLAEALLGAADPAGASPVGAAGATELDGAGILGGAAPPAATRLDGAGGAGCAAPPAATGLDGSGILRGAASPAATGLDGSGNLGGAALDDATGLDGVRALEGGGGRVSAGGGAVRLHPIARCGPAALLGAVQGALTRFGAQVLVVDALPAGVLSELGPAAALPCPRVLVARRLRRAPPPELLARYARVFDVEPALPWAPPGQTTRLSPIAEPSDAAAGAELVCVAGDAAQARLLAKVAARLDREGFGVALAYDGWLQRPGQAPARVRPVPLAGARLLIGPAGYNLVYEARALGVPQLALPLAKALDDQAGRAEALAQRPTSPEALLAQARAWLRGVPPPSPAGPDPRPPSALAAAICAALPALLPG